MIEHTVVWRIKNGLFKKDLNVRLLLLTIIPVILFIIFFHLFTSFLSSSYFISFIHF